ncbi:MAG: XrtN system VIT domain-containing protein [Vicingaceae bacterium]|nr:XrtN system VIT domain-containing protein [Vicingaceae bacterium]
METKKNTTQKDPIFLVGLILIPISFGIYLFLYFKNQNAGNAFRENEGAYYINYVIAAAYFIFSVFIYFFKHKFKFSHYSYKRFACALILFAISCFTINIPFPIFHKFSAWVNVYLIVMHLALLATCFLDTLPRFLKHLVFFGVGLGTVMALYFTIYLLPFLPIMFLGAVFFGLSLHLATPLILLITLLVQFFKNGKDTKIAFYLGVALPLLVVVVYVFQWNSTKKLIDKTHATIITRPNNNLPNWVLLSQELGDDFFTERILKGDLIYETHLFSDNWGIMGNQNSLGELKEHDPLVVLGAELLGTLSLNREDKLKILESKFDLRHATKRKLWSGENLSTTTVLSNIQVFPDYRLAYTEKIIRIKNNYNSNRWNKQEEALYTFHLPEGSVATSLSLWIEGKEEKSRLTTKSKADSAYTTIVGVERRDPSIMHWQEGNTITVYVFPCTPEEERMFKVGITTPLRLKDNQLVLENVYFEGPDASSAAETTIVEFKTDKLGNMNIPNHFSEIMPNKFEYSGNYHPYWEISCPAVPLSTQRFSFNGKSYLMIENQPKTTSQNIKSVFLDINNSWTKNEFNKVWESVKDKKVYVFYDQLYQLNSENKERYYELLSKLNFSLFPLYKVKDIPQSLLITKSSRISPTLEDLKNSSFSDELKTYLSERTEKVNLFNLSDELSPYLKTLKEFQVFNYTSGDMVALQHLLNKNVFVATNQDENSVLLDISNTVIKRDTNTNTSTAPDHLLRLFAYNKIMQECGRNYFTAENYVENNLIDIANEAYIVSPISSLIVLETIKDYERFGIDENKNSLKNASTESAGAVPEPHEWALIIILMGTLVFLYYKRKNTI